MENSNNMQSTIQQSLSLLDKYRKVREDVSQVIMSLTTQHTPESITKALESADTITSSVLQDPELCDLFSFCEDIQGTIVGMHKYDYTRMDFVEDMQTFLNNLDDLIEEEALKQEHHISRFLRELFLELSEHSDAIAAFLKTSKFFH